MQRLLFKVEKNRVLVPVGEPCSFGCKYCYTRGGEVGLKRVSTDEILQRFERFAHGVSFDTIQFGYDGDPFVRPLRGLKMLEALSGFGKHVNFSTKAALEPSTLSGLAAIQRRMRARGTTLSALVSVSCWDSSATVEPHTPSSEQRMLTAASLRHIDIPAFIAVRPILPHIADEEYERIAVEGVRVGCNGFVLGPLYADDRGQFVRFIPPGALEAIPHRRGTVTWAAHAPTWTRYEDEERLQRLTAMIEQKGGQVFFSSADAMDLVGCRRQAA